ncbi:MAG TPA: nucleotidyl transferase AbiEii/AbiGii toxin family protein [Pyrinomonadaceae bacterium]|nr:nucleotidyl transferase AbiEii/AbiGii toxin family protein [Pyrinomonadaceae bacterium]
MPDATLPVAFVAALEALTSWLETEHVPYTTIGGVAVSLLAQPRATQDIDIVIWLDQEKWESLLQAGKAHGFEPRINDALGFAVKSLVLLLRHQRSGVSIDLSCGALPFEREMIARAQILNIGALSLRVPTPEDLIITKAVAQRPKDVADMESLLNIHHNLDIAYIRLRVEEFAVALEMPELMENLERLLHHRPQQST